MCVWPGAQQHQILVTSKQNGKTGMVQLRCRKVETGYKSPKSRVPAWGIRGQLNAEGTRSIKEKKPTRANQLSKSPKKDAKYHPFQTHQIPHPKSQIS
jgi:hypothetical protein